MDYWYLSPLRGERTPSFKINRELNRWFDHGLGRGGNLVDFAMLYHKCSLSEVLQKLDYNFSFQQQPIEQQDDRNQERAIRILETKDITAIGLVRYLAPRKIPLSLANQFCREVRYNLYGKVYYGIGFKNDSGGYEIRNPYFKGSCMDNTVHTLPLISVQCLPVFQCKVYQF